LEKFPAIEAIYWIENIFQQKFEGGWNDPNPQQ